MLRYIALAGTACLAYFSPEPSTFVFSPAALRFLEKYRGTIHAALKYALAIWGPLEVNAALSRWAENRWLLKSDKSAWHWPSEIAVVTGGSRGIGAVVVQQLAQHGMKVAVLDIVPLADGLQKDQSNLVHFYQCDITSKDAVQRVGEAIRSDIGNPSILINNAGIGNGGTVLEMTQERLNTIFQVNLLSHWNTVQEFLPSMIAANKGHIMSVASLASFVGLAGAVDYSCTKAGVLAFHEGLTQELKHRYRAPLVKTTIVHPNWTRTRLTDGIEKGIRSSGARILEPRDVASAMVRQITENKSGQLILGPRPAPYVRAFPTWLQELVRDRSAKVVNISASTAVGGTQ